MRYLLSILSIFLISNFTSAERITESEYYLGTENAAEQGSKYDDIKILVFLTHMERRRTKTSASKHLLSEHFRSLDQNGLDNYIDYLIDLRRDIDLTNKEIKTDIYCPRMGKQPMEEDYFQIRDEVSEARKVNMQNHFNHILRDWGLEVYDETRKLMNLLAQGIEINLMDTEAMHKNDPQFNADLRVSAYCSMEGR